jgi:subtilisin family serine protease
VDDFADGIRALARAGANIIVDDVIYFEEPMFQDGAIAQAGAQAVSRGVAFFSSAGNDARDSYEAPFRDSGRRGLSGRMHDFDPGRGVDTLQSITATAGSTSLLSVQWDQPFFSVSGRAGSASDIDAYFVDADGVPIEICTDDPAQLVCQFPGVESNIGGDALELPALLNYSDSDLQVQLAIELYAGPKPGLLKYVWFDLDAGSFLPNEYDTASGTSYGHTNGPGIEAVGAAGFYNTAAFGQNKPECGAACLQNFSSAGGVPILFDKNGHRLPVPQVRLKPGVTGPDGGDTTFFYLDLSGPIPGTDEPNGYPNFFGTSASAPHVAAVGALMIEKRRRDGADNRHFTGPRDLSPDEMYGALRSTAQDIRLRAGITSGPFEIAHGRGYDFDSGFGFVDAVRALQAISGN